MSIWFLLKKKIVRGSHDIKVVSDRLIREDLIDYDMIFLPGGLPGATNLKADHRVLDLLRQFDKKGKWIAAICAAPSVLAAAGIIEGRKLTSYPILLEIEHMTGQSILKIWLLLIRTW
jgi:protein deglycase